MLLPITQHKNYQLVAIGSAIVDIQTSISDSQLHAINLPKGNMSLISEDDAKRYQEMLSFDEVHSGGSASNSVAGFCHLGGKAAFIGRIGNDSLGDIFNKDMQKNTIDCALSLDKKRATSSSYIMVSDDGERTMATLLAASAHLSADDIDEHAVHYLQNTAILYIEGYLYDTETMQAALRKAVSIAKKAGAVIAFSLSDAFCIMRHQQAFWQFITDECDIVFCNYDEAKQLTGADSIEAIQQKMQSICPLVSVTNGGEGAWSFYDNQLYYTQTTPIANPVDTTGAGDQYAAGFLYALSQQATVQEAAALGCAEAAKVIMHYGGRP